MTETIDRRLTQFGCAAIVTSGYSVVDDHTQNYSPPSVEVTISHEYILNACTADSAGFYVKNDSEPKVKIPFYIGALKRRDARVHEKKHR